MRTYNEFEGSGSRFDSNIIFGCLEIETCQALFGKIYDGLTSRLYLGSSRCLHKQKHSENIWGTSSFVVHLVCRGTNFPGIFFSINNFPANHCLFSLGSEVWKREGIFPNPLKITTWRNKC